MKERIMTNMAFPDGELRAEDIILVNIIKNSPIMEITTSDKRYFTSTEWVYFYDTNSYAIRNLKPCQRHT